MRQFYFGGKFDFEYKDFSINNLSKDYRSIILGDVNKILYPPKNDNKTIELNKDKLYIGPYYFYEEDLSSEEIVKNEFNMVEKSTDVIFLLNNDPCPGTITELMHASFTNKNIYIFYIKIEADDGEPKDKIKSKQWYPIIFSQLINNNIHIFECNNKEEAINKIKNILC